MRSVPLAIAWEMLKRGRGSLVAGLLISILQPGLVFGSLRQVDGFDLNDLGMRSVHIAFLAVNIFVTMAMVLASQGMMSRLYTYPVTSATMVACHMGLAMAFVIFLMLTSSITLNALFGLGWPLWGPALFAAAVTAAFQASVWFAEKTVWVVVAMIAVAAVFQYWSFIHMTSATEMWIPLSPLEVGALFALAAISYFVGVVGVSRNRRGETIKSLGIIDWFFRIFDRQSGRIRRFQTPADAQLWYEWQKKGWGLPAIACFGIITMVTIWTFTKRDPKDLMDAFVSCGPFLSIAGAIVGMIIGHTGGTNNAFEMGSFEGSRPLTNSDIANAILKMTGRSVLLAWGIWVFSFFIAYVTLLIVRITPQIPEAAKWWYLPVTLIACWAVVATVASLCLTGRVTLLVQIAIGIMGFYFVILVSNAFTPDKRLMDLILNGLAVFWGIGFLGVTAWTFAMARRKRLIGAGTVSGGIVVWVILCILVVVEASRLSLPIVPGMFVVIGLAALPVFPFAAAPLAVSWNRSR